MLKNLTLFSYQNKQEPIKFIETIHVTQGVICDVYEFLNDKNKDLAIIHIHTGCKTPLQKVLKGDKTIEGYLSGKGKLVVKRKNGKMNVFQFNNKKQKNTEILVNIGDTMQWIAGTKSLLVVYEICFPPYKDERYENLKED
jgi:hypothetical protein